jgi:dienelactone hydrolase
MSHGGVTASSHRARYPFAALVVSDYFVADSPGSVMTSMPRFLCLAAVALIATGCATRLKLAKDDSDAVLSRQLLAAPDPSQKGPFAVRMLSYGSGTDKRRTIFRDSITLTTKAVDGSAFASAPDKGQEKVRKRYWGFDFKRLPVNGRVWYPDAPGPFPLVLIVHGNHDMKDFSDPGYGYLGELLASRGFILASVDENFLNGFMRGENDARGWMLLKHLERWRAWNDSSGGPFAGRVDMHNIALMGHSRGGEAVAVAGALNRLSHYPDDANVKFDFNFDIKSLVAIAPVDGQYRPADKPTPLANYNYLLIHGSHDGDVSTFSGLTQYERIRFTDGQPWFKSAVYVYRANHGQWNTVWNNKDNGPRSGRFLDLRGLLTPEDQRRFAEVYITGFLEATLRGKQEYLPMFRDHRVVGQWLPKTMYLTRFQENEFHAAADFEEDVDVTTGSVQGVALAGDSLSTWKEAVVPFRYRNSNMAHNAVWLGWSNRIAGDDTTKRGQPATYTVTLTDSLRGAWHVDSSAVVVLSLAPTDATPEPRSPVRDSTKGADSTKKKSAPKKKPTPKVKPDSTPFDLTVDVIDADGKTASAPLSRYGAVRRPLESYVYLRRGRDKQRFAHLYELVLQTYAIPLRDLSMNGAVDLSRLRSVRLRFDRTVAGTVVLDNIGFSHMRPEFFVRGAGTDGGTGDQR